MGGESPRPEEVPGVLPWSSCAKHCHVAAPANSAWRAGTLGPPCLSKIPHHPQFLQRASHPHPQPLLPTMLPLMPGGWDKLFFTAHDKFAPGRDPLSEANRVTCLSPSPSVALSASHDPRCQPSFQVPDCHPVGQCLLPLMQPEQESLGYLQRAPSIPTRAYLEGWAEAGVEGSERAGRAACWGAWERAGPPENGSGRMVAVGVAQAPSVD